MLVPTYSYSCKDCGHAFDIQQAFSDDALTVCPSCAGTLRKVFSAVGVVFKGSGFYRTDSRGSGKASTTSTPSTASSDGASKSSATGSAASTPSGGAGGSGGSSTSSAPGAKPSTGAA